RKAERTILKPILRWETQITQVRSITAGSSIGYGKKFICDRDMDIAIVPVGYADGYRTQLSNKGEVLIHGTRCPVCGSVSMDQIVVELRTKNTVKRGDPVVLIGKDGNEEIHAEELAEKAGTIVYDILTGIGPRVLRTYINKDEEQKEST
ncbi:MAG: alanine racemase, partial [Candidatus Hydrogenedens sp.]